MVGLEGRGSVEEDLRELGRAMAASTGMGLRDWSIGSAAAVSLSGGSTAIAGAFSMESEASLAAGVGTLGRAAEGGRKAEASGAERPCSKVLVVGACSSCWGRGGLTSFGCFAAETEGSESGTNRRFWDGLEIGARSSSCAGGRSILVVPDGVSEFRVSSGFELSFRGVDSATTIGAGLCGPASCSTSGEMAEPCPTWRFAPGSGAGSETGGVTLGTAAKDAAGVADRLCSARKRLGDIPVSWGVLTRTSGTLAG